MSVFDVPASQRAAFREQLPTWFARVRRELPWRRLRDPYRVWISEIMLQQTRVDQATPYFERFTERFPDVASLAAAPLSDVLLAWEGLGYYSRARNLHRAARLVMEERKGYLPESYEELRRLPGIGPYTAAAISSIAFGRRDAVVDGNVIRVLARVFGIEQDARSSAMRRTIQELADKLIPADAPGDFNEAMMELGATVCTPRDPNCPDCPLENICLARRTNQQERYPKAVARAPVPRFDVAVGILLRGQRVLIQQRPADSMLGGLWEFPGGKCADGELPAEACRREVLEETGIDVEVGELLCSVRHTYSHFGITLHAYLCRIINDSSARVVAMPRTWVDRDELQKYAFPRANRRVLEALHIRAPWDEFG